MKSFLKSSTLCLLALVSLAAASARAQTRDDRLISAKAGGVNFVAGDVKTRHADGKDWLSVSVKDDLRSGDAARTGADGRVEVLLNPGSYLRAGASTEFELEDASLDNLRVRLTRGSVLVEATGYGDLGLDIEVATPQTRVSIVRTGVYRIDVSQSGETAVSVLKGRALVGEGAAGLTVKAGKVARVGAGVGVEVAKADKKQRDELDLWSRERGKELAKVNDALANRQTNTLLASYSGFPDIFNAGFPSSAYGLWMWSYRTGCYTFLPFYTGWRSPYGYGYGSFFTSFGYYNDCWNCPVDWYRRIIVQHADPTMTRTPNTTVVHGAPPPSTGGGFGSSGGGNTGGGITTVTSPSPSASSPVERGDRPTRERTFDQGARPPGR
jgi:hypothetical protein